MADQEAVAKRAAGLTKLFNGVIYGHRELNSSADGIRFLEALCTQEDASKCVECLITAKAGLSAVAKSFRFSRDSTFLNGAATSVIEYLSQASLKQLYGGQFLHRVLEQIVYPPTFWNTFVEAHNAHVLTSEGTRAFAWLLLEILYIRSENVPDARAVAEQINQNTSFTKSDDLSVRNIGYKIRHFLDSTSSDSADGPGGRHDNDHADYSKIKILPTPDEFASVETPFYRRSDAIKSVEPEQRGGTHLDNQFRLLREDLLGELRNDFQISIGQKKGRRKVLLENLQLVGVDCGPPTRHKLCSLKLRCTKDIPQLHNIKGVAVRKKYITENKNLMKHQSLGCLISHGNIVAFASVDRDEDLLAQEPSIAVLHIADTDSFSNVLMACKTASDLAFVQVDTAVFAYEPILRRLQSMTELPMEEQLLSLSPTSSEALSSIHPSNMIKDILDGRAGDLQNLIGTDRPVRLDIAQTESLIAGLAKKVSLIQGPPGEFIYICYNNFLYFFFT